MSFIDLGQGHLGKIFLKPFLMKLYRLMEITNSNILITRMGVNSQMSSKFDNVGHFALEMLAVECLNSPYLT